MSIPEPEFPDAVAFLVEAVAEVMDVPVGDSNADAEEFVKIYRIGGPRASKVSDQPTIVVEVYARRPARAAQIIGQVRDIIFTLPRRRTRPVFVYRVAEYSGPGDLPDASMPEHARYTMTESVHLRLSKGIPN